MFVIMVLAGALSTMNVWADKITDLQFTLNDLQMISLMTGWMFVFMGVYFKQFGTMSGGAALVAFSLQAIRTQLGVGVSDQAKGMIVHHSMAVHMSKKLLQKGPSPLTDFARKVIEVQENEIQFLKSM